MSPATAGADSDGAGAHLGTVPFVPLTCSALPLSLASLSNLAGALLVYPEDYDDAFEEAGARMKVAGHATKLDIGGLACWRRIRCDTKWARRLQATPQSTVVASTRSALGAGLTPEQRVAALRGELKHGMGGSFALGSAILAAWNSNDFAVTDRWVLVTLRAAGCDCDIDSYSIYLQHVIGIRDDLRQAFPSIPFTARDVDKALYFAPGVAHTAVALLVLRP